MKRHGFLFEKVCAFDALVRAAHEAARGKRSSPRVAGFLLDIELEVLELEEELLLKTYHPRPYHTFMVHDPKDRMICAADFRDRVVHHALCAQLGPIMDRSLISDTYACRTGRGTHKAVRRTQMFCQRFAHFLKLDVRKFFDSVDHRILKAMLRRVVKDPDLLWLADLFIDHPVPWTAPGKGLPIGNLTSQHFANYYLSGLDHFIKERLRIPGFLRYMDDLVLLADEKTTLWDAAKRVEAYLWEKLRLRLKQDTTLVAPVSQGLPFLGFRIYPGVIKLSHQSWRRFRRRVIGQDKMLAQGIIGEETWQRSISSLVGHVRHANSRNLRMHFFEARGDRGSNRVNRGGSWNNPAHNCRSAYRNNDHPGNRNINLGFRLSSSQQGPDATRSRTRRQRQSSDHRPGPVPSEVGQTRNARRRQVGGNARTPSPTAHGIQT